MHALIGWNSVLYQRLGKVDDIMLAFKFLLRNFENLTQIKHPLCNSDKVNINELFVSSKYGSWRPSLTTVV